MNKPKKNRIYILVTDEEKKEIYKKYGSTTVMRYILLKTKKPNLVN